jgi:hypothetical protein
VPVVQATQPVTISKSALTISLTASITGLPTEVPFKIQVAGSKFNDRVYTVVGVNGLVLSLLERPNRNEAVTATVALANITLTFAGIPDTSLGKVYFRHFNDPVSGQEPQCVGATYNAESRCEDGAATAEGFFNAQVKCANSGTEIKLPCEVQGFAGNSQSATFTFPVGEHNFSACENGAVECAIGWSDPAKVTKAVCNKSFPAVTGVWELCQTLKFTISAGASISNFTQRAFNSAMTPSGEALAFTFVTRTDTPGGVPVNIIAGPDPIQTGNPGSSGVLTVSITNNEAANLQNIDVTSVVLTFRNYGGAGAQSAVVQNDRAPESCGTDCRNFKFGKTSFLDAYLSVFTPANCTIPDNTAVPVHLVGAYTTGGEVFGDTAVHTNGAYTNTNPAVCTP